MKRYEEIERTLAALLGWKHHAHKEGKQWESPSGVFYYEHPYWCRDWHSIGNLMVQYRCYPYSEDGSAFVDAGDCVERFSDHANPDTAVRYAIVRGLILKLQREQGK